VEEHKHIFIKMEGKKMTELKDFFSLAAFRRCLTGVEGAFQPKLSYDSVTELYSCFGITHNN